MKLPTILVFLGLEKRISSCAKNISFLCERKLISFLEENDNNNDNNKKKTHEKNTKEEEA